MRMNLRLHTRAPLIYRTFVVVGCVIPCKTWFNQYSVLAKRHMPRLDWIWPWLITFVNSHVNRRSNSTWAYYGRSCSNERQCYFVQWNKPPNGGLYRPNLASHLLNDGAGCATIEIWDGDFHKGTKIELRPPLRSAVSLSAVMEEGGLE